jgi:cytoskeletal protein CcmA (bactofilin family)
VKFGVKKKACVTVSDGIQAGEAHIHGSLEGRLNTVGKVFIYPNGKILGDLHAKELIVQEGGIHKGTFDRIART